MFIFIVLYLFLFQVWSFCYFNLFQLFVKAKFVFVYNYIFNKEFIISFIILKCKISSVVILVLQLELYFNYSFIIINKNISM